MKTYCSHNVLLHRLSNLPHVSQPPATETSIEERLRPGILPEPCKRKGLLRGGLTCKMIDDLSPGNDQIAIEPDLERSPFIEHQLMARFKCGHRTVRRSLTSPGSSAAFSSVVHSGGGAFPRAYDNGLGNLFLRHSLAPDFSLVTDLTQP